VPESESKQEKKYPLLTAATYSEAEKALLALWRKAGMLEGA